MSHSPISFTTTLQSTGKTTTGIVVPAEVIARLDAGARPAVSVKVNKYLYRTTVGVMGGRSLLPFSAENRAKSGLQAGDAITVELTLDTATREIETPADLETALRSKGLGSAFASLAPSRRRADIANITGAKTPETRERRIAALITRLTQ